MTPSQPRRDGHADFDELAVGHALSALEPEEEERFAAHLQHCTRCQSAVAEHAAVLTELAHDAPQVEPPPSLLAGIRAEVAREPRAPVRAVTGPPASAPDGDELSVRRSRRSVEVGRSALLSAAAAVVALVVGLGGWNAVLQRDNAQVSERADSLAAAVRSLEDADTRTVRLSSPQGDVVAVAVVRGEEMSLVLDGLRPNPEDTVYVLWGQSRYGDVRAVGTFDVEDTELGVLHGMRLEPGIGEITTLMVTHEQGRTPPAVTTQPVVAAGEVRAA